MTVGEIVLPDALQTPAVLDAIRQAALNADIPLEQLRVGSALNSINPHTGQPEFNALGSVAMDWISRHLKQTPTPNESKSDLDRQTNTINTPPSDQELDYNPNGPGEFSTYLRHPVAALPALWHGYRARQESIDKFGENGTLPMDNEGDGWRHARWSQRMAASPFIGPEIAKELTDAHERGPNNNPGARSMDLVNNRVGRILANEPDPEAALQRAIENGWIRTRRY